MKWVAVYKRSSINSGVVLINQSKVESIVSQEDIPHAWQQDVATGSCDRQGAVSSYGCPAGKNVWPHTRLVPERGQTPHFKMGCSVNQVTLQGKIS